MADVIHIHRAPDIRFARSTTRHRISRDRIHHVIANYRARFEEPPPEGLGRRSIRIVYLGEDPEGGAIEVMAVKGRQGELLVIHAMELRAKYRERYQERGR